LKSFAIETPVYFDKHSFQILFSKDESTEDLVDMLMKCRHSGAWGTYALRLRWPGWKHPASCIIQKFIGWHEMECCHSTAHWTSNRNHHLV